MAAQRKAAAPKAKRAKAKAKKVATRKAKPPAAELPFWQRKSLTEMTSGEWEQLCDGCGKCCLHKLEDTDSGAISYTNVACRLLDLGTCRCSNYKQRRKLVHDCLQLSPKAIRELKWLPPTCGYRLVDEGKDLYWWHPLVSGDPETVHQAGISVRGRAIAEKQAGDLEDHIVDSME